MIKRCERCNNVFEAKKKFEPICPKCLNKCEVKEPEPWWRRAKRKSGKKANIFPIEGAFY